MYGSAGFHGLYYVVGWTGGYVLLLLMAFQVRRFGRFTAIKHDSIENDTFEYDS